MKIFIFLISIIFFFSNVSATEVNIFSSRHYDSDKEIYKKFTSQTGIKVNVISGKDNALHKRIVDEGKDCLGDLYFTADAGRLGAFELQGLFQKGINSEFIKKNIPHNFKSDYWVGIAKRARVIFYNPTKTNPPKNLKYEDLSKKIFKGKIAIRQSNNIYNQSLVASILEHNGLNETKEWIQGLVKNFARPPKGNDRAQILAVAAGEAEYAIANTYYLALMLSGKKGEEQKKAAKKVIPYFPNQKDRGTHMNISGAGILKYAPNKQNAIKLLEFLLTKDSQTHIINNTFEYPIIKGVEPNKLIAQFGTNFKQDLNTNVSVYSERQSEALKIMTEAGWR
ncbi:MAG: extracellular solute-binding protein [Candidatus Pelagibacter bacterium]|nr:extracellular solute-binding protein [Candidatus Pelagibacter bacterium]